MKERQTKWQKLAGFFLLADVLSFLTVTSFFSPTPSFPEKAWIHSVSIWSIWWFHLLKIQYGLWIPVLLVSTHFSELKCYNIKQCNWLLYQETACRIIILSLITLKITRHGHRFELDGGKIRHQGASNY